MNRDKRTLLIAVAAIAITNFGALYGMLRGTKQELREEIRELRVEVRSEFAELRKDLFALKVDVAALKELSLQDQTFRSP
ncbi:MAG: hypothetical protein OXF02_04280 [Simkaniaceae bacterium]|nr:hypothetical protein [Simkaniaceae bacterium]